MKKPKIHIVITGGHHNSALVVAQSLVKLGHRVTWIGHRTAASGDTHDSAEYIEVSATKIPFHDLRASKLTGLLRIPYRLFQSSVLLNQLNPDAILSFGSYLGFAVSLAARIKNIPVFIHEQTVIAGKANKLVARFARKVYLTWESSKQFLPNSKTQVVGLPLRSSILNPKKTNLFPNSLPTILVLGGKQGSHAINNQILTHLPNLLADYNIIHQTGSSSVTGDYKRAVSIQDTLPPKIAARYHPEGYIGEVEIGSILSNCDLYIGRSGAHITYELGMLGIRSILIPFLSTHAQEQQKNAQYLVDHGIAVILPQTKLSFSTLQSSIRKSLKLDSPEPLPLPHDATEKLVGDMLDELTL